MFISAFCKICEQNTEHEIVCFDFCRFSRGYNKGVISVRNSYKNKEIIKQTDVLLWKI